LDSILLTTGRDKIKARSELWDDQAHRAEAKWNAKVIEVSTLTWEETRLRQIADQYKEKAKEAQSNYELRKDKWRATLEKKDEADFNVVNLFRRKKQYTMLHQLSTFYLNDEGWSNKDADFVKKKLGLIDSTAVAGLEKDCCYRVLHLLDMKNYCLSESFTTLWNVPPNEYKLQDWKDRYKEEPQILLGHTNRQDVQIRLCDYLRLSHDGIKMGYIEQCIPDNASENDLDRCLARKEAELQDWKDKIAAKKQKMRREREDEP